MFKKWKSKYNLIIKFFAGARVFFAVAVFAALMTTLLNSLTPQLFRFGVDSVVGGDGRYAWFSDHLWVLAILLILLAVVSGVFQFLFRYSTGVFGERFAKNMRDTLFSHIQRMPVAWQDANQTGDIIQRCTSDVETIRSFVSKQLPEVFRTVFLIVVSFGMMLSMNVKLSLLVLVFIPIIVIYSVGFYLKIWSQFIKADEAEGELSTAVQENATGVRVIRAFGREQYEMEHFQEKNMTYTNLCIRLGKISGLFWGVGDLFTGLQVIVVIVAGAVMAVHGQITVGEFIAFASYNSILTWPIRGLGRILSEMSRADVSFERIGYIVDSMEEQDVVKDPVTIEHHDIRFEHVSFSYSDCTEQSKSSNHTEQSQSSNSTDLSEHSQSSNSTDLPEQSQSSDSTDLPEQSQSSDCIDFVEQSYSSDINVTEIISEKIRHKEVSGKNINKYVLKDVSLNIPEGSTVGILGGTGSGKSTLIQLLMRLYELEEGEIRIGGVDIRQIPLPQLRSMIGIVLQEPFLYSKTIRENIAAGRPDASLEEIREAARIACVDDAIMAFADGYDTIIGERGITLSGGQRQRVAIARMLMERTPIMIFDDSLSAVDSETDYLIRTALKQKMREATVILISHRITSLMSTDQILVMKEGEIVERGTHRELIARQGIYHQIYDIQMNLDDRLELEDEYEHEQQSYPGRENEQIDHSELEDEYEQRSYPEAEEGGEQ